MQMLETEKEKANFLMAWTQTMEFLTDFRFDGYTRLKYALSLGSGVPALAGYRFGQLNEQI